MKKIKIQLFTSILVVSLLGAVLTSCSAPDSDPAPPSASDLQQLDRTELVLGTFGAIRALTDSPEQGEAAIEAAFQRISEIENLMSASIAGSEIDQINENAGIAPVTVSDETLYVIEEGINYAAITQDAFNIGLGELINLWGIGKDWQKVPTQAEIDTTLEHIDISQIEVNGNEVFLKDPDMRLDLGGIAKGYAVDQAAKVLKENGIDHGFVNMGGDVYSLGVKADGTQWRMGISAPEIDNDAIIARLPLSNMSIVTSGDYERFFIQDDVRYHHILDPSTGHPTANELVSVTIISDQAIDGDVLSTSVFVMGLEEGLAFLDSQEGIEGILVTKDRKIYPTSGISSLEILDSAYTLSE